MIQRPDPRSLWEVASLLGLDFGLILQWSRLSDQSEASVELAGPALRAFLSLSQDRRIRALDYLERLSSELDVTNVPED